MAEKALNGTRVLELAEMVAGPYCGKVMADLGAEVVKIEPPRGDQARSRGPFPEDRPHPEKSGLFLYLNTSKLGVTLNLEDAKGRDLFRDLIRQADVLIEDRPPGALEALDLGYESLQDVNPRLVMTSITPFGQTGPYSHFKAYPMNSYHGGGDGYLLPTGTKYLDRPPVKAANFVGEYEAGVGAAAATLIALYWRDGSGEGQHVDISKQDWGIGLNNSYLQRYPIEGFLPSRESFQYRYVGMIPCKDGFLQIYAFEQHHWEKLVEMMGNPAWAQEERFQDSFRRGQHGDEINALVTEWLKDKTKEEVYHRGQQMKLPLGKVDTPADLLRCEQLKGRGFFREIAHPAAGTYTYPSAPYAFSATPWAVSRPAPLLGEHNEEIFGNRLGYPPGEMARLRGMGII